LSHIPGLLYLVFDRVLHFCLGRPWTAILLSPPPKSWGFRCAPSCLALTFFFFFLLYDEVLIVFEGLHSEMLTVNVFAGSTVGDIDLFLRSSLTHTIPMPTKSERIKSWGKWKWQPCAFHTDFLCSTGRESENAAVVRWHICRPRDQSWCETE
jgi:hypothetical protein